jgi:hypothetical protein
MPSTSSNYLLKLDKLVELFRPAADSLPYHSRYHKEKKVRLEGNTAALDVWTLGLRPVSETYKTSPPPPEQ